MSKYKKVYGRSTPLDQGHYSLFVTTVTNTSITIALLVTLDATLSYANIQKEEGLRVENYQ